MEWLEKLNQSINYLEDNLSETISYEHAAQIACCSTFHFQGCFHIWPESRCRNISATGA